ncbi:hypothetical protein [Teredinibacter franksiae]|uniref:hypothetical protein n=1 Tax=Teredinibacter franksiae TaxID=2761453 RepID=UPI001624CA1E|nr:hypothetical protein [Teredinibacter franksiae]
MDLGNLESDELLALSEFDLQRELYTEALVKLKLAKGRTDVPIEVHALLGRCYASMGLLARAKASFSALLEIKPDAIHELFQLGMVERDMGNVIKAMQIWDQVLEAESAFAPALFYKAVALVEVDERQSAIDALAILKENPAEAGEYLERAEELLSSLNIQ